MWGGGLAQSKNSLLFYLKPLVFNPCTPRILWSGKMGSPPKCWQLHPPALPPPALERLMRSQCPPSGGSCPWNQSHKSYIGSIFPLVPLFTPLGPTLTPCSAPQAASQHSQFLASCLLTQLGGKTPVKTPKWTG